MKNENPPDIFAAQKQPRRRKKQTKNFMLNLKTYKTMKTHLITFVLLLLISGLSLRCQKADKTEPVLWELPADGTKTAITETVDSIEFKFCLLNEADNPATVFKEGENFTFNFSVKNKLKNSIIATTEFINSNFFRVYRTIDNVDMGRGWSGVWCDYSLEPKEIEYKSNVLKQLNCPWTLSENTSIDYPLCMSEKNCYLAKGEYDTSIHLDFHYTTNGIKKNVNGMVFKINFKIE